MAVNLVRRALRAYLYSIVSAMCGYCRVSWGGRAARGLSGMSSEPGQLEGVSSVCRTEVKDCRIRLRRYQVSTAEHGGHS
jgi:hypothetical protein